MGMIKQSGKDLRFPFTVAFQKLFEFSLSKHDDLRELFPVKTENLRDCLIYTSAVFNKRLIIPKHFCIDFCAGFSFSGFWIVDGASDFISMTKMRKDKTYDSICGTLHQIAVHHSRFSFVTGKLSM